MPVVKQYVLDLKSVLITVPGLPSFAVAAITREVESRIAQWLQVSKDLSDDVASLPNMLSNIGDETEWEYVMALICTFGGQRVYVPKEMTSNHPISRELGDKAAAFISRRWGGEPLLIPKAEELLRAARDKAIIADAKAGMAPNDIAKAHDLAYPWVVNLLQRHWREQEDDPAPEPKQAPPKPQALVISIDDGAHPLPRRKRQKTAP